MTLLRMAAGYRQSAELIRLRIAALRELARGAEPEEQLRLERRIRDLRTIHRETTETARTLERYYERRRGADGRRA